MRYRSPLLFINVYSSLRSTIAFFLYIIHPISSPHAINLLEMVVYPHISRALLSFIIDGEHYPQHVQFTEKCIYKDCHHDVPKGRLAHVES